MDARLLDLTNDVLKSANTLGEDVMRRRLLGLAVVHWKQNLAYFRRKLYKCITIGSAACPLCAGYKHRTVPCCFCPIRHVSGERFCQGTPWEGVHKMLASYEYADSDFEAGDEALLVAEVEFLERLQQDDREGAQEVLEWYYTYYDNTRYGTYKRG